MNPEKTMMPTTDQIDRAIQEAFAEKADADGWANLATIGKALKKLIPSFNTKDYDRKNLTHFLQNLGTVEIHIDDSQKPPRNFGRLKSDATIANIPAPLPPTAGRSLPRSTLPSLPSSANVVEPSHPNSQSLVRQSPQVLLTPNQDLNFAFSRTPNYPGEFLICWSQLHDNCYEDLKKLALPETWEFGGCHDPKRPFPILVNYLRYTFYRLWMEKKVSVQGNFSAINTGLVDRFYQPIFALFNRIDSLTSRRKLNGFCIAGKDTNGKLLVANFNPLPAPPDYFKSPDCIIYDKNAPPPIVDWDHVIIENLQRLPMQFLKDNCPKSFQIKDTHQMAGEEIKAFYSEFSYFVLHDSATHLKIQNKIEAALKVAIRKVCWNFKTAIPFYFPTHNKMCMLLPLALVSDEETDIALVVEKKDSGNYQGHTILPLDLAYNNARLVCPPNSDWLSPDSIKKLWSDKCADMANTD